MKSALIVLAIFVSSLAAIGQSNGHTSAKKIPKLNKNNFKWVATYPPPRRYDHALYNEAISLNIFDGFFIPIWQDSTIFENKVGTLTKVKYSSVAQTFFVTDNFWNDPANPMFIGKGPIYKYNSYQVDSVRLMGFYLKGKKADPAIVDTLLISVAYQPDSDKVFREITASSWLAPFLPSGKDTLFATAPTNVDSIQKMTLSNPISASNIVFKVPLVDSMRLLALPSPLLFQEFSFKLPSPLLIPCCKNVVSVSYTFKSGDVWLPNVDTIDNFHHFMPAFLYPKASATSSDTTHQTHNYYKGDHSMSSLMDSKNPTNYTPTVILGAQEDSVNWKAHFLWNSITVFSYNWPHVDEWIEDSLAIGNVDLIKSVKAFPNPVNDELHFSIITTQSMDCSILVCNVFGQLMVEYKLNNLIAGKEQDVTFNTKQWLEGVYFYKIVNNGHLLSDGKFVKN
jgi:hypothetical protein